MESKFKFQKPVYPTKSTYLTKYIYPEDITINSDDFVPITTGKYYEILKFIMSKKKLLQFKNGDDDTVLHMILNNGELTETEKKDIIIKSAFVSIDSQTWFETRHKYNKHQRESG